MTAIDITFDVFSDTPKGKDPDSYSPTLRNYHKMLWSKPLPSGKNFSLDLDSPRLLHHKSDLGEFFLSSDAITHSYHGVKKCLILSMLFRLKRLALFMTMTILLVPTLFFLRNE